MSEGLSPMPSSEGVSGILVQRSCLSPNPFYETTEPVAQARENADEAGRQVIFPTVPTAVHAHHWPRAQSTKPTFRIPEIQGQRKGDCPQHNPAQALKRQCTFYSDVTLSRVRRQTRNLSSLALRSMT